MSHADVPRKPGRPPNPEGRKPPASRRRADPFTQGHIAELYKVWLAPLVKYKPQALPLKDFWETLFRPHARDIVRFVCKSQFRMPGLLHLAANVKVQGVGKRRVKQGRILYVRTDAASPNVIEVEVGAGHGFPDQMFSLTQEEWNSIAPHLRVEEREKKEPKCV